MIQQRHTQLVAVWLGLFAMLMIHVGPLISGAQALSEHAPAASVVHAEHDHANDHAQDAAGHAGHDVDYHALMGHHSVPDGMPQWLANLEMCGYCDLLTVSPPMVLSLILALAVPPAVQWLTVLPAPLQLQPAAHSLRHSRAPPVPLFV